MNVKISTGNVKMNAIPSVSLPAVKTCAPGVPCSKKCYAVRIEKRFPAARASYENNFALYIESPEKYFSEILQYIRDKKPLAFRWHVSGDIPDTTYLRHMVNLAKLFPDVRFLAYTKQYAIVNDYITTHGKPPVNMIIRFSKWDAYAMDNKYGLPVAYCRLKAGNVDAIPETAHDCPHYITEKWSCLDCAKSFCGCYGQTDIVLPEH